MMKVGVGTTLTCILEHTKVGVAGRRLKVHAAGVFRVSVLIECPSAIIVGEKFFDFPVALFRSYTEF